MSALYPDGAAHDSRARWEDDLDPDELDALRYDAAIDRADADRKGEW